MAPFFAPTRQAISPFKALPRKNRNRPFSLDRLRGPDQAPVPVPAPAPVQVQVQVQVPVQVLSPHQNHPAILYRSRISIRTAVVSGWLSVSSAM